jgi:osmoprotectant transport system permease protein
MIDWGWIGGHIPAIAGRLAQHLEFAVIALLVGFVLSFALAILSVRRRRLYPVVTVIAGIVYTIPSIALFSAMVPITGLTLLTVEIPLVLYSFVILVRNIVAGFDAVPAEVTEAAEGMGYTRNQRLWRVEVPLAIPLMVAGLRVASVSTIGLVTITGILGISFGGMGFFIFERLTGFPTEVLVGAVGSIALALLADAAFAALQQRVTPWTQPAELETARLETIVRAPSNPPNPLP